MASAEDSDRNGQTDWLRLQLSGSRRDTRALWSFEQSVHRTGGTTPGGARSALGRKPE